MITQILVALLALIAGYVSYRQYKYNSRANARTWFFIVLYWIVLTIKNLYDLGRIIF